MLAYWHLIAQKDSCRRRSHDHFKNSINRSNYFFTDDLGCRGEAASGSDASSHVNKGVELAQQRKYDEAIKEFNAAIEANPKSAKAYLNRGTAYRALQKYDEAMADFAKAIEIAPKDEMGYIERGQTFVMQKQYTEATGGSK